MRRLAPAAVVLAALLALAPAAVAAVRGDDYYRPINITSTPFTSRLNTKSATWVVGEPVPTCVDFVRHTVWYTFTPPTTAFYIAETLASDFTRSGDSTTDTAIGVYTGTTSPSPSFSQVACDDDGGDDLAHQGARHSSWLDVELTGGTTYYIQVSGYGDSEYGRLVFKLYLD